MRSSALAEELIGRGFESIFVGQVDGLDWVKERIDNLGFSRIIEGSTNFISDPAKDILILDSYEINLSDDFINRDKWKKIISISDDTTPKYICDLVIHPGLDSGWLKDSITPFLFGPEYILIRKSIQKAPSTLLSDEQELQIVVVGGGSDPTGFCSAIADFLQQIDMRFQATFITDFPITLNGPHKFRAMPNGDVFDKIAGAANLILTTASVSSLEFIAQEIPVGIACAVENQRLNYESLAAANVAIQIGEFSNSLGWQLNLGAIRNLISNPSARTKLRENCSSYIDLDGASRVADVLVALTQH
jgi:spore coat polysaccharide biosynthesis predicted glycosyltransferase SpsG